MTDADTAPTGDEEPIDAEIDGEAVAVLRYRPHGSSTLRRRVIEELSEDADAEHRIITQFRDDGEWWTVRADAVTDLALAAPKAEPTREEVVDE